MAPLESTQNSLNFGSEDWDWWTTRPTYYFRGDELVDVFSDSFDEEETLTEAMPPTIKEKSSTPALEQETTIKTRQKRKRALVGPEEGTPTSSSASLAAPQAQHIDATLDEAKAKVLAHKMLLSRFRESTGSSSSFIPWSAVEITGWPNEISCYQPHNWLRPELEAFFAAYDKIRFKLKEGPKKQKRTGENLKIYNEIKGVLIERNLIPEDAPKIRWKELSGLAPGLRLSSREYKRWSESDREAIREHLINPFKQVKNSQDFPSFDELFP